MTPGKYLQKNSILDVRQGSDYASVFKLWASNTDSIQNKYYAPGWPVQPISDITQLFCNFF